MSDAVHVGQVMQAHALSRYRMLSFMSLQDFRQPHPSFCRLPAPFAGYLAAHAAAAWDWLDAGITGRNFARRDQLLNLFIENTTASIHTHNPYILIRPQARHALTDLYDGFILEFRDALEAPEAVVLQDTLQTVMTRHQRDLDAYLHDLAGINPGLKMSAEDAPVASEYSAALQLRVLRLDEGLTAPVLDVGCGSAGHLVAYLQEAGIPVLGVDRLAGTEPDLLRADWLTYPLEAGQWGTIVSHMAFSVHFLHHHLRVDGTPEAYARRYMALLDALRPGGRFCYTPGLPFIEDLLPRDRYIVRRYPVANTAQSIDEGLAAQLGAHVLYATHVIRR